MNYFIEGMIDNVVKQFKELSPNIFNGLAAFIAGCSRENFRKSPQITQVVFQMADIFFNQFTKYANAMPDNSAFAHAEEFFYFFSLCISDGSSKAGEAVKSILQTKEFLSQYPDFSIYFSQNKKGFELISYRFIQGVGNDELLLEAAPIPDSPEHMFPYYLVLSGILYNIREYFSQKREFNQDYFDIIEGALPYLKKTFVGVFKLYRTLIDTKVTEKLINCYYDCIIAHLQSPKKQQLALEEIIFRSSVPVSGHEAEKLNDILLYLLDGFRPNYKTAVQSISKRLVSSGFITQTYYIFEKVKNKPDLCYYLYDIIKSSFPPSILDDVYLSHKDNLNLDVANFLNALISDHYQSSHLESIFEKLITMHDEKDPKSNFIETLVQFSANEEIHNAILKSINNLISNRESTISKIHFYDILSYLDQHYSDTNILLPIFEKLSAIFLDILDSIEILPTMKHYSFLKIKDLEYFVDIAPHNSLFYQFLSSDDYLNEISEVVDDITTVCKDDDEDIENSITFYDLLFKAFEKTNDIKFLLSLLIVSRNQYQLFDKISSKIDSKALIPRILSLLQRDSIEAVNFKNNLIQISKFIVYEGDNVNDHLNNDQIAFLISIGFQPTEQQLIELFNSSQSFYPKLIVLKKFPNILTLLSQEDLLNAYIYSCSICNFELCELLYTSFKPPSNLLENDFLIQCLVNTRSNITILTLKILSNDLNIFTQPVDIKTTILNLANCEKQDQFSDVFCSYLAKMNRSDEKVNEAVFDVYFDSQFPSIHRIEVTFNAVIEFCSSNKSFFRSLLSQIEPTHSLELKASTDNPYLYLFSNLPSIFNDILDSNYQQIFHRLAFGYEKSIESSLSLNSIHECLQKFEIKKSIFEIIQYTISPIEYVEGQYAISISPAKSVSESLKHTNPLSVIKESPKILILQIQFDTPKNFIIDDKIDLSSYSLNTSYYHLNSILCENNDVYLRNYSNEYKYIKCSNNKSWYENSVDSNLSLLVYERVESFEYDYKQHQISNFVQIFTQYDLVNYSKSRTILHAIKYFSVDWNLLKEQDDFIELAFKLITEFDIYNLFKFLMDSPEFVNYVLDIDDFQRFALLVNNEQFAKQYHKELVNFVANIEDPAIFSLFLIDIINQTNYILIFDIIDSLSKSFGESDLSNRLSLIESIDVNLIHTQRFKEFLRKTVENPKFDTNLAKSMITNLNIVPLLFKLQINDSIKSLILKSIKLNDFKALIDHLELSEAFEIIRSKPEIVRKHFHPTIISKFASDPQFPNYLNEIHSFEMKDLEALFKAGLIEQASSLLIQKVPPNYLNYNADVSYLITDLLKFYSNDSKTIGKLLPLIQQYSSFFSNPEFTKQLLTLAYSLDFDSKQILRFAEAFKTLPPIQPEEVGSFFIRSRFTKKYISDHYMTMLFIVVCRTYSNHIKFAFTYESQFFEILQVAASYMKDKNLFFNLVWPIFQKGITIHEAFHHTFQYSGYVPYIYLRLLKETFSIPQLLDSWKTSYVLSYLNATIEIINHIYLCDIYFPQQIFMLPYKEELNQADQLANEILVTTINAIKQYVFKPDFPQQLEIMPPPISKVIPDSFNIEKYSHAILEQFYNLLRFASFIYPYFNYIIVKYIIDKKDYNFYENVDSPIRKSFTNLVINSFKEILGDREYMESTNSEMFKMAIVLIKSQFMQLLQTPDFTYNDILPYINLYTALLRYPNQQFSSEIATHFANFPFVFNILLIKELKKEEMMTLLSFFSLFLDHVKMNVCYPAIFVKFFESLDLVTSTDLLNCKLLIFQRILNHKNMDVKMKQEIVRCTFTKVEKLSQKYNIDQLKPQSHILQKLFDAYIIDLGNDQ